MKARRIREGIYWVGAVDWDRRLFDSLIPLPDGTSYNAYVVRGSEKTVLIDTVDPTMTAVLFSRLDSLSIDHLDFVVVNHAEQDHSGSLPQVLARHPEAKVLANQNCKKLLIDLLHVAEDKFVTVEDGEVVSLGDKHLQFVYTPWVHWPETMGTYVPEDKILFSGDFFGSHIASSKLYACDEGDRVCEATKRYFAEIMMPFRLLVRKNLDKVEALSPDLIAPTHGLIYDDVADIIKSHRLWVSDEVSNTVVVPYVSMHGSTLAMVDCLTETLLDKGTRVEKINLTVADLGKLAAALVDAATIVIGSPTVLAGAHPLAVSAAFLTNALRPKLKFASIIGSYGWGGKTVDQLTSLIPSLKVEILPPVLVKGYPRADDFAAIEKLATDIVARHRENNIV